MVAMIRILTILVVVLIIINIIKYNKMVKYYNKVQESLSLIDIYLKNRFDLIPNLVNTVKGYAKHEKEIFEKLIELRKCANEARDEKTKLEYANEMVPNMRYLFAVAESYPELKADKLFKSLMEELVICEDKIAAARRFYDNNVSEYNTLISTFPNNIIASMFNKHKCELYRIECNENINVKLNFNEDK